MTKSIGSYEVIERRPGASECYLARQAGKKCLVRVLEAPADEDVWEAVRAHVAAASALQHEAMLPTTSIEEVDGKLLAVSSEPASKTTLASLIDRKLPPAAAWFLGQQVAGALAVAHATSDDDGMFMALCHGFLDPEQVFVAEDGGVQVLWLGLAPLVGHGIATPGTYAPPEQRGGGRVTPRGDMYSVAAMLWAILAGKEPPESPSLDEVSEKVPADVREPLERALESSVGKRRITAMEAEQWLGDLAGKDGRGALGASVKASKADSSASAGAQRRAPLSTKKPRAGRGMLTPSIDTKKGRAKSSLPPFRSKSSTLLGARPPGTAKVPAPRKKHPSAPPIDWNAAQKAASRPSEPPGMGAVDNLFDDDSWDEQETVIAERPSEAAIARAQAAKDAKRAGGKPADLDTSAPDEETVVAQRPVVPIANELPPLETDDEVTMIADRPSAPGSNRGDRLSQQDLEQAFAQAESAVDALGGDDDVPTMVRDRPAAVAAKGPPPLRGRKDSGSMPAELLHAITPSDAPAAPAQDDDLTATLPVDEDVHLPKAPAPEGDDEEVQIPEPTPKGPPPMPPASEEGEETPSGTSAAPSGDPAVEAPGSSDEETAEPAADAPPAVEPGPAAPAAASEASPWSTESTPPPKEEEQVRDAPLSLGSAVLIMLGTAAVVMGAGIWWVRSQVPSPAHRPAASAKAKPTAREAPKPKPRASSAPSASTSTSASASAVPSVVAPAADASKLAPNMGYLVVSFPEAAQVYVNGKKTGAVGVPLEVPCGFKNVRIGTEDGTWLSDGKPVKIDCRKTVEIGLKKK